jgi:LAO/AO transport system kinase
MGPDPLAELCAGGKPALARALARAEAAPEAEATLVLLDSAFADPRAHVVGLTGPPGVGKSTLASALVKAWRGRGLSVGVIAIDPSSHRTGGALLGDRTRIEADPDDLGVFVRSMAARDRLGGLADLSAAAVVLMRAVFDVVLVETVGVGQSETEVADLADTVVLAVQPGSGDGLQYMKAGIVEIPDLAVVTKADLGALAERARRDLEVALSLAAGGHRENAWSARVLSVSASNGRGIDSLVDATASHDAWLAASGTLATRRAAQAGSWLERALRQEFGRRGVARARALLLSEPATAAASPFRRLARIAARWTRLKRGPPPRGAAA